MKREKTRLMALLYVFLGFLLVTGCDPVVTWTQPEDEGVNFPVETDLLVAFSAPMASSSVNASTFLLESPTGPVTPFLITMCTSCPTPAKEGTFRFVSESPLEYETTYTATIKADVRTQTFGFRMLEDYVWSFTTEPPPGTGVPPMVVSMFPERDARGVPVYAVIRVTFDKDMDPAFVTQTHFWVDRIFDGIIEGDRIVQGTDILFVPHEDLDFDKLYLVRIGSVRDTDGNPMIGEEFWPFHTASQVDGCGDGTLDPSEECDDGNTTGGDGCRADCTIEACGDGIQDPREQCDDGNGNDTDGCRNDCTWTFCGDGIPDPWEECDDGANLNCDGCSASCLVEFCGDGMTCTSQGEECDDGNNTDGDGCTNDCQLELAFCGNGNVDPGEECDDGNNDDGDGCSATCLIEGDFDIISFYATPQLQFGPTGFPRFDSSMEIEIVTATNNAMSEMQIDILNCVEPDVSDCTPVVETTPPATTMWALRAPGLTGEPGGRTYSIHVTATAPTNQTAEATFDMLVYPFDPSVEITCTKRNDPVEGFQVDFDVLQNGQPLTNIFEHRLWLYEDKNDGEGFAFDETDSFQASFAFIWPVTFSPGADGHYQVVFTGTDFTQDFQGSLFFTDDGGPDDVCVWE